MSPQDDAIAELSREFALACDTAGVVRWTDERTPRTLDVVVGARLRDRGDPGTAAKVDEMIARGARDRIEGWELSYPAAGGTDLLTVSFNAGPLDGGVLLVGHVLPTHYHAALAEMDAAIADVVHLNRETARQKHQIAGYADQLRQANDDLVESNRGILSLHRELEDRALTLTHSSQVKTRVVASVSHEFRTPLNSILGLTQLLLDRSDGPLSGEQEKQVRFIRASAEELMTLVTDLLDLAKIESGTASMRITTFSSADFVSEMRGALRPLRRPDSGVELEFEGEESDFPIETDRAKLSQIVRNLISNAIKFTERGEVRFRLESDHGRALLTVSDTGVGIPPGDVDRVFEEFAQVDNPLQSQVKGTGLGLPIVKRLTEILGGEVSVDSTLGEGTTFTVSLPLVHPDAVEMKRVEYESANRQPGRIPVLVVEDDRRTMFVYERYLSMAGFQVVPARTVEAARQALAREIPVAIVLDVVLEEESTWSFLSEVKNDPRTQHVPVLVVTVSDKGETARALGADEFWLKPLDQARLLRKLRSLATAQKAPVKVLVVDDDERARYLFRKYVTGLDCELFEASTGDEGIAVARRERPRIIFLDFLLESMTAFDVLDELKSNPHTRGIPVIIVTSHNLTEHERARLSANTEAVISKQNLSRELAINRIRDALRRSGAETTL